MMPPLSFLQDSLTVEAQDNGQFSVTVILPPELVRSYCLFLDSLSGFFRHTNRHVEIEKARSASSGLSQEAETTIAAYRDRVVNAFDAYTAQGMDRKDSIKQIAADLRAEDHPWRFSEQIRSTLVAAGRGGRPGRPARGES